MGGRLYEQLRGWLENTLELFGSSGLGFCSLVFLLLVAVSTALSLDELAVAGLGCPEYDANRNPAYLLSLVASATQPTTRSTLSASVLRHYYLCAPIIWAYPNAILVRQARFLRLGVDCIMYFPASKLLALCFAISPSSTVPNITLARLLVQSAPT